MNRLRSEINPRMQGRARGRSQETPGEWGKGERNALGYWERGRGKKNATR